MGHSEDYIRNKMYELEKEKVEIEREKARIEVEKCKVLADIRELLMAHTIVELTELAGNPNVGDENYERAKGAFIEAKNSIEKRWSE